MPLVPHRGKVRRYITVTFPLHYRYITQRQGASTLADLPWLLENGLTGTRKPPNPTDGPCLTIVRASVAPPGGMKRYVAVSVSRDGGYKYDFVARTPAAVGQSPEWNAALPLGKEAHAWDDKAKLKLLFLEETTLSAAPSPPPHPPLSHPPTLHLTTPPS